MKTLLKIILIAILSFVSWLNFVNAWDDDSVFWNESKSSDLIKWKTTGIPVCQNWECGTLENSGDKAVERFHGNIEDQQTFSDYVQEIIKYLLTFLTIIWVIYIIYAWVLLLTSAWEEEKMTAARKNILYVMIWITVIYLAYPIVSWVVKAIS